MHFQIKKIFFITIFNSCLFILLVIGLQNNSNKTKVDLLVEETVKLPIGFIVGTSFITGSIIGNFFNFGKDNKNKD
ncbi:MAG: hypothetical protein CBE24_07655 [bacterium TMED264]|nr:MAG: hypothetical protein CBE24_07655 [bacterium TMED264]|tara:strand:+ start:236 stop:463 length:228 start_codon:yes stop_codon:yes gene_type:complete